MITSPKPKNMKFSMIQNKDKLNIFTREKMEQATAEITFELFGIKKVFVYCNAACRLQLEGKSTS